MTQGSLHGQFLVDCARLSVAIESWVSFRSGVKGSMSLVHLIEPIHNFRICYYYAFHYSVSCAL